MASVKNLHGTAERACTSCGTWLKHWEKLSGEKASYCGSCYAMQNLVGAHVRLVNGDGTNYITPLCGACNHKEGEFSVSTRLVSARKCD